MFKVVMLKLLTIQLVTSCTPQSYVEYFTQRAVIVTSEECLALLPLTPFQHVAAIWLFGVLAILPLFFLLSSVRSLCHVCCVN